MSIKSKSSVSATFWVELNEVEARALLAMTRYGHKQFLDGYYKYLGRIEMERYACGIESLFNTIKTELPRHLDAAKIARDILTDVNNAKI